MRPEADSFFQNQIRLLEEMPSGDSEQPSFDFLDLSLARYLISFEKKFSSDLEELIRLLSYYSRNGHVCLDLNASLPLSPEPPRSERDLSLLLPAKAALKRVLRTAAIAGGAEEATPLTLEGDRLYLRRLYLKERSLIAEILRRRDVAAPPENAAETLRLLEDLFPDDAAALTEEMIHHPERIRNPQARACVLCLRRSFLVLSGGPGTGKTATAVKALTLLLRAEPQTRLAVAAPTGKAALRLGESLNALLDALPVPEDIRERLPTEATTLHRLLGAGERSGYFRYHRDHPLPLDFLLVDEASMADLPLLARVMEALPPQARVLLVGDRHQLASVEAGAALGDICRAFENEESEPVREETKLSKKTAKKISRKQTSDDQYDLFLNTREDATKGNEPEKKSDAAPVIFLEKNYRFGDSSGIAALAREIRGGAGKEAFALFSRGYEDLGLLDSSPDRMRSSLARAAEEGYAEFRRERDPEGCLELLGKFRILASHRGGPRGVRRLNEFALAVFADGNAAGEPRPILVNRNDYRLRLFNGDTGVLLTDGENRARVYFREQGSNRVRSLEREDLPSHELCYAMTVHKSQGSEFDRVLLVLPEETTPLLTRELIYTAVTRAREKFLLCGAGDVFAGALERTIRRPSGIYDALRGV